MERPESADFARFTEALKIVVAQDPVVIKQVAEAQHNDKKRLSKGASLDPAVSAVVRSFVERT